MRHAIEVVTTLGDTCVERIVVGIGDRVGDLLVADGCLRAADGREIALPAELACGLGTMRVASFELAAEPLARRPLEVAVYAILAASLTAHVAVLGFAFHAGARVEPAPRSHGSSQARLVANHAMATRARKASTIVRSTNDLDRPELVPDATPGPPVAPVPAKLAPSPHVDAPQPAVVRSRTSSPGLEDVRQASTEAARHFDPCANGDCGLIATSRDFPTSAHERIGDDYKLPPRDPRALETAVVTCDVDGDCNTASGTDERDVRTEISHHLHEIDACFTNQPEVTVAIDARVDGEGAVHVVAHDPSAAADCIARIAETLTLASGDRNVTLAFARDR